jgi:putative DNA primase/helicase
MSWESIAGPHGWQEAGRISGKTHWLRPADGKGDSATTTNEDGIEVWRSSASPFEAGEPYTKCAVWLLLNPEAADDGLSKSKGTLRKKRSGSPATKKEDQPQDRPAVRLANPAESADDRPEIEVTVERHEVVDAAIKALSRDPEIYTRGGSLGIVIEEENATAKLPGGVELQNAKGAARFLILSRSAVGCRLTKNARFYRADTDKNGEPISVDCHPPASCIEAVETWGHWRGIRSLQTICQCPYVRADGSIPEPGFDASIGALYRPSVELGNIPAQPSRRHVRAALERLYELSHEFPWGDGFDQSVWLASLLTAIMRPVISGPVPGFAFNGNRAGTGKGLLIDVVGLLTWGHPVPTRAYPRDDGEAEKAKLAIGLAGIPAVHFDNLREGSGYGGGVVDSSLTSTVTSGRLLGFSRDSGPVPLRPVWLLSGNNIAPYRDAYRRWLPCNLMTTLEDPHLRDDVTIRDLRRHVAENRARLLRAALVILRAHALEGRPHGLGAPLGSFEEWDEIVRGAVHFAAGVDCLETQRRATKESPDRLEKAGLLIAWHRYQTDYNLANGMTVQEILDAVRPVNKDDASPHPAFHSTLLGLSKDGKLPSARELGNRIRSMQGQNVNGLRFIKRRTEGDSVRWLVEIIERV